MVLFRRKPTDVEIAEVQRWEHDSLKRLFSSLASVDAADDLWPGVEQLVLARSPRDVLAALEAHPVLLTDRGDAALEMTELFVTVLKMPSARAVVADRHAWIEWMRTINDA